MFWDRFFELCKKNNISPNAVCSKLGLSTATATHWKNGSMPKGDVLSKIADFFNVSVDYLLNRTILPNEVFQKEQDKRNNIMNDIFELKTLSESQRAMLKCRMNQLMINRFRKEDYFEDLNSELQVANSSFWFFSLNDFSLDDKISDMLKMLNVDYESLFNDMNIVIKTKNSASALRIDFSEDANFPILVPGSRIFESLSSLSISSLSVLDDEVLGQINIKQEQFGRSVGDDIHDELKTSVTSKLQV